MKINSIICFFALLFALTLTGCIAKSQENEVDNEILNDKTQNVEKTEEVNETMIEEDVKNPENQEKDKKISILFIGNSYTYYNTMPTAIFRNIAKSAGYDLEVKSITNAAHTLAKFADPEDAYGKRVEKVLTGTKKYDYVILQEQSVLPANANADNFYSAVRNLHEKIETTGAETILYSTWGRKEGSDTLTKKGWTSESMTWKLASAYQAIGDELNISVAHVGLAFLDVYTNQSDIELYNADLSHPSYAGSYLAAVTLFAKIFECDPTDLSYTGDLTETEADILCESAKKAVFDTPAIPDEYKTSSQN